MFAIDQPVVEPLVAASIATLGFIFYHFMTSTDEAAGSVASTLKRRGIAVTVYGVLPVVVILVLFQVPADGYGVTLHSDIPALPWIGGCAVLAIGLGRFTAKNRQILESYPQIREREWNTGLYLINALSWIAYLVAYEFLFRGFLLFSWFRVFGFWPAVVINIAIYSLVHLPKGLSECIGSIVVGALFCVLTLKSGTILIATAIHIVMAISNESWALIHHPNMRLSWQQK